ncbi:MAG: UDP-N-acetylmuramate dehydrogenase [Candidatus Kerfeldbacteria bacterium]|nr:UDP-N-acetylmuramate dehydrogenase [Candidatus Kerfeldbacteria bacterium]
MNQPASQALKERFPTLREGVSLARYSTYRIGGPARFFLEAHTTDDVVAAIRLARAQGLPYAMLGSGSNTLIADQGFAGLVIVARAQHLTFDRQRVTAEAGVKLSVLTVVAAQHGFGGLEFLIGVPGTVGGAIYGNAGSRDAAIGNRVASVEILDAAGRRVALSAEECAFGYRTSRFKTTKEPIVQAVLVLPPGDRVTLERQIATVIRAKNAKQPTHDQSAGCMFKNVPVDDPSQLPEELRTTVTDGQLSAWRLIVAAGLKGKRLGHVQVSPQHANFLVNLGGATADEVVQLLSYIKQQVRDRFHIQLHEEIQYLGFDLPRTSLQ